MLRGCRRRPRCSRRAGDEAFENEWDRHYVASVGKAIERAFELAAWHSPQEVYSVLAEELRRRGIDPDPEAELEGAVLISRGRRPAVLN